MLLPLLLAGALSYTKGYHTFTVKHDHPFAISLKKNLLVFALNEILSPVVNFTVIDRRNRSIQIPFVTFTHLYFFETTILVTVPSGRICLLHYWLLPTALCSSISYAAIADHQLSFRLSSDSVKSDFCIFTQSGASTYTAIMDYYSASPRSRIEFYTSSVGPDKRCRGNGICEFKATRPFFIRVANVTGSEFDAKFTVWALRRSIESSECMIQAIPIVIEPPILMPLGAMLTSEIKCVSMAEDMLRYIVIALGVVVAGGGVLVLLHRIGYINIMAIFGCMKESD
jgi:hypothetical protein